jgi:type I restriction-modification system DNA methylase subunit
MFPLLWFLIAVEERKKERRKMIKIPKIVATFVYASSQGQRTHSAQTKNLSKLHSKQKAFFGMRMKSTVSITASIETNTSSYLFQALLFLTEVAEPTNTTAPTTTTAAALATTNPDQTKPVEGEIFPTPFQYFLLFPQTWIM